MVTICLFYHESEFSFMIPFYVYVEVKFGTDTTKMMVSKDKFLKVSWQTKK